MKLNREAFMLYLDSTFKKVTASAKWVLIGDDIEELSTELNPDMETTKNILGQTKTKDNGYEPTTDADPFMQIQIMNCTNRLEILLWKERKAQPARPLR